MTRSEGGKGKRACVAWCHSKSIENTYKDRRTEGDVLQRFLWQQRNRSIFSSHLSKSPKNFNFATQHKEHVCVLPLVAYVLVPESVTSPTDPESELSMGLRSGTESHILRSSPSVAQNLGLQNRFVLTQRREAANGQFPFRLARWRNYIPFPLSFSAVQFWKSVVQILLNQISLSI